ncbi:unnamed protein product [Acanthosepion pharaonis]|uniref:Uncharacterized protein n=1 Tax=Acanthosepion pharaonis TaxID=158019 RepID=A0A812BEV6_ACAPH|nr:unnamed protein product [Sepia pharaonis]
MRRSDCYIFLSNPYFSLSVFLSLSLSLSLFLPLTIYLSIYLTIYLSIYLFLSLLRFYLICIEVPASDWAEYKRRAAVVASFRVGKRPADVIALFSTYVFVAAVKVQSPMEEARATPRSPLTRAVTSRRSAERSGRTLVTPRTACLMLITNATKESRKVNATALLDELKHGSAEMMRFFSDEKNFIQDRTSNRHTDRWIGKYIEEVPVDVGGGPCRRLTSAGPSRMSLSSPPRRIMCPKYPSFLSALYSLNTYLVLMVSSTHLLLRLAVYDTLRTRQHTESVNPVFFLSWRCRKQ